MGIFGSKKDVNKEEKKATREEKSLFFQGILGNSLGKIPAGALVVLTAKPEEEKIAIQHKVGFKTQTEITLPYERIVNFKVEDEKEIIKKDNGVSRAIVGGLLFGGAGAVVGAMTTKNITEHKWYGVLTYIDKNGDEQQIVLKEVLHNKATKSLNAVAAETCITRIITWYAEDITEI